MAPLASGIILKSAETITNSIPVAMAVEISVACSSEHFPEWSSTFVWFPIFFVSDQRGGVFCVTAAAKTALPCYASLAELTKTP